MSFFDSELVQTEMQEISKLQEKVYSNVFTFPSLDRESKLRHINDLETLMEKQKILYMQLALSDVPSALNIKLRIQDSVTMIVLPEIIDKNALFANMIKLDFYLKLQLLKEIN